MRTGWIFDIKEMAMHDGPGVRTTVFLQGCPLRCRWCHNPEGLTAGPKLEYRENRCRHCRLCEKPCSHPECLPFGRCVHICPENCLKIVGRQVTADGLARELTRSAEAFGDGFGGFTFSGGEPLVQADFLLELFPLLKSGLCIETCGYAPPRTFQDVCSHMDFVFLDVKLADPAQHIRYTGKDNAPILENLRWLMSSGIRYRIRTPLIPGMTDTEEKLSAIRKLIGDSDWERLPYNAAAGAKYKMLGIPFPMERPDEQTTK